MDGAKSPLQTRRRAQLGGGVGVGGGGGGVGERN